MATFKILFFEISVSPGHPSLLHSHDPCRQTLQTRSLKCRRHYKRYFVWMWLYIPCVAVLGNCKSWRKMFSHMRAGTLRYFHTAIPIQNFARFKTQMCLCYDWLHPSREKTKIQLLITYQDMYSHPHTPPCRPPVYLNCGKLWSRTWCIHCTPSRLDT